MKNTLKLTAVAAMSAFVLVGCAQNTSKGDAQLQQQAVLGSKNPVNIMRWLIKHLTPLKSPLIRQK